MRNDQGKFLKGHVTNKPFKERTCIVCGSVFLTKMYKQKYCGSATNKTGCSYKNKLIDRRWGKPRREKKCEACEKTFIPTGNNQKLCGSKSLKYSCSWNRANNKKENKPGLATWLRGFSRKIA